jgi:hypothetical protein
MRKTIYKTFAAAAVAVVAPFLCVSSTAGATPQDCRNCYIVAQQVPGYPLDNCVRVMCAAQAPLPATGFPDCDAMQLAANRDQCAAQHIAGQR